MNRLEQPGSRLDAGHFVRPRYLKINLKATLRKLPCKAEIFVPHCPLTPAHHRPVSLHYLTKCQNFSNPYSLKGRAAAFRTAIIKSK